jgi:hypothetical protein
VCSQMASKVIAVEIWIFHFWIGSLIMKLSCLRWEKLSSTPLWTNGWWTCLCYKVKSTRRITSLFGSHWVLLS